MNNAANVKSIPSNSPVKLGHPDYHSEAPIDDIISSMESYSNDLRQVNDDLSTLTLEEKQALYIELTKKLGDISDLIEDLSSNLKQDDVTKFTRNIETLAKMYKTADVQIKRLYNDLSHHNYTPYDINSPKGKQTLRDMNNAATSTNHYLQRASNCIGKFARVYKTTDFGPLIKEVNKNINTYTHSIDNFHQDVRTAKTSTNFIPSASTHQTIKRPSTEKLLQSNHNSLLQARKNTQRQQMDPQQHGNHLTSKQQPSFKIPDSLQPSSKPVSSSVKSTTLPAIPNNANQYSKIGQNYNMNKVASSSISTNPAIYAHSRIKNEPSYVKKNVIGSTWQKLDKSSNKTSYAKY